MFKKFFHLLSKHKIITLVVLLGCGYWYYHYKYQTVSVQPTKYVLAKVEKGTIISSVSGTGQVSASNQLDIKAKASGDVLFVGATNGQEVKTGALLAQIDSTDAQKTVRDAEANLESAKISLAKLIQPVDSLSLLQAENSLISARNTLSKLKITQAVDYQNTLDAKQKAEDALKKAYDDGFNTVANAFLDLSTVMTGLNDILFGNTFSTDQWNIDYYANAVKNYDDKVTIYKQSASDSYQTARTGYDKNFDDYKTASRFSSVATIESLIDETYETTKNIAEAIKNSNTLIQFYTDKLTERNLKPNSISATHLASLNSYTGKTNSHLLNLLSIKSSIQTDKETIAGSEQDLAEMDQNNPLDLASAEQSVKEKEESLKKIKAGADALDIQSQKLTIKQRENSLIDARAKLADYFVRAPFDGIIAAFNVKKGDPASGAVIATIITGQRLAEISLNEVDVAKVQVGQKATLTFDAVPGLDITGVVAEIETIGAVSQGVVSYTVKINFDTQDERIKPGMSISANVITNVKADVLTVPNSAVKSQSENYFVQILDVKETTQFSVNSSGVVLALPPVNKQVQVGIANDELTEITSGLVEGDVVIKTTISSTASTATQSTGFRIPGIGGR